MTTDPTQAAFEARYANLLDLTKAAAAWGCQTYVHSHVDAMWAGWKACAETRQAHSLPEDMLAALRSASWLLADVSPDGLVKKQIDEVIARAALTPSALSGDAP